MEEYKIKHFTIYKSNYEPEAKFREELSNKLIDKFGIGPYSEQKLVREAITFSYNYFCEKFLEICYSENSVRFYQLVLSQHEQAIEIALFVKAPEHFPEGIDLHYIALYRRILKWILEQACDIELLNQEEPNSAFLKRAKSRLNELMFLGDMMFSCATLYAEQDMIEDVAEIIFDNNGLYEFKHKHHYDFINREITKSYGSHSFKHVADSNPVDDLKNALITCFGIEYDFLIM